MTENHSGEDFFADRRPPVQAERQQRRVELTGKEQQWLEICRNAVLAGPEATAQLLSADDNAALRDNPTHLSAARASKALAVALTTQDLSCADVAAAIQPLIEHADRAGLVSTDLQLIDPRLPLVTEAEPLSTIIRYLLVGDGGKRARGFERVRGFTLLLALEFAGRPLKTRHHAQTTVLVEVGGCGKTATLHLRHLADGPVGLHPDPATMLFLEADQELVDSFAQAWRCSRGVGKACVVWSVIQDHGVPATILRGPSMGAAMAVCLDDLLPRPRTGRWRWRELDPHSSVTAGLDGLALTRVGYYGEKLKAAQAAALRVIVAKSELDRVRDIAPAGFGESVRGAATVPEAIKCTRRNYNRHAFGMALLAFGLVVVVTVGGAALVNARLDAQAAEQEAQRTRTESHSRLIASAASDFRPTDPAVAQLMALAAYRLDPTVKARSALLDSTAVPTPGRFITGAAETVAVVDPVAGRWVCSIGGDGVLRLSSTSHYSTVLAQRTVSGRATALAVDRTGSTLAVALAGAVHVMDIVDGQQLRPRAEIAVDGVVRSVAFGGRGTHLVVGTDRQEIQRWDIGATPPRVLAPLRATSGDVIVTFNAAGDLLVTGDAQGELRLWDYTDPQTEPALRVSHPADSGTEAQVHALAVSPDGTTFAVGGRNDRVALWRISAGEPRWLRDLTGFRSYVNDVSFSADGRSLAAGSSDNTTRVWNLTTVSDSVAPPEPAVLPDPAIVSSVEFTPDGRTLVTAGTDGVLRFWPRPGPILPASTTVVFQTWWDRAGTRMLSGTGASDPTTHHWDFTDPAAPRQFPGLPTPDGLRNSGAAAFSLDGRLAAVGTTTGHVHLWDVGVPESPRRRGAPFAAVEKIVAAMTFDPSGSVLAVASQDHDIVTLWDVTGPDTPVRIGDIDSGPGLPTMLAYAPQGDLLAIATSDDRVLLWDVTDPRHPRPRPPLTDLGGRDVLSVAISRDGRLLAAGDADHSVHLVDITDRDRPRMLPTLRGPADDLLTVNFSPATDRVVAGGSNGGAWVWNIENIDAPALYAELRAYNGRVNDAGYGLGGRILVGAGPDKVLRIWATDPESVAAALCSSGTSQLTHEEWERYLATIPYQGLCP